MFRLHAAVACMLCVLMSMIPAKAQVEPDVIERGKRATALVEVVAEKARVTGSAFCIDTAGLFVTSAHVIEGAESGGQIQLVLDIGRGTQRALPATARWINDEKDLALLTVKPQGGRLVALTLGRDDDLKEGAEVTTFGFPFGRALALKPNQYPEVSVNLSRVTTPRREGDRLGTIKFDGQLSPGNSGGPVLGPQGELVGVAVATVVGGGVNFAIPVGQLTETLATPGLQFVMPPLSHDDRTRPTTWHFNVVPPWPSGKVPDGLTVVVTLTANLGDPRVFTCRPAGNAAYELTLAPVPSDPDRKVVLEIQMGKNHQDVAYAEVKDCDVTVGTRRIRLSDLRLICFNPPFKQRPFVHLAQGGGVEGNISGLGTVTAKWKEKTTTLDLTRTESIKFGGTNDPMASIRVVDALAELRKGARTLATRHERLDFRILPTITARTVSGGFVVRPLRPAVSQAKRRVLDDEGLVTIGGLLDVDGAPRGAAQTIRPPMIPTLVAVAGQRPAGGSPKDALVRALPGQVSGVVVGGGGRYLLLLSQKRRELAIFDVNAASVVKTLSLPNENVLVAAGARKFFLVYADEGLIQRWDFEHLTADGGHRPLPIKGQFKHVAMGSDSDGPLLAYWRPSEPKNLPWRNSFIGSSTLQVLRLGPVTYLDCNVSLSRGSFSPLGFKPELRTAPAGNVFGLEPVDYADPRGLARGITYPRFAALTVRGATLAGNGPSDPPPNLHRDNNRNWSVLEVPSSPPYYLVIHDDLPSKGSLAAPSSDRFGASIHAAGDGARLLTIPLLEEMVGFAPQDGVADGLPVDQMFHFIPAAKLLITIPPGRDRLVLRRVDLDAAIGQVAGGIVVLSPPSINAWAGQPLNTQIEARSALGNVRFALVQGPKGLTVSPEGLVSWPTPEQPDGVAAKLVVSLRDPAGRSRSHAVMLRVR